MIDEFKRLKQHLNYLKETYKDIEIMYIGLFKDNQNYTYTIAWYLPKVSFILDGKRPFSSGVKLVDNFNIKLDNMKDSFEISLVDIRYIKDYKDSSFIKNLIESPYRIINKDYKFEVLHFIDGLYTVLEQDYLNRLVCKYIKNKMNWAEKWEDTRKFTDLNEYIKKYNNIFVTSDLHLFHKNILKHEPEREKLLSQTKFQYMSKNISQKMWKDIPDELFENQNDIQLWKVDISNRLHDNNLFEKLYKEIEPQFYEEMILEHNKKLIDNYNQIVGEKDLCFILGDFSLGNARETEAALHEMRGDKILLIGNHDSFLKDKTFDRSLFLDIKDYLEVKIANQGVVLSHYPILHFKKQDYDQGNVHLYGHIHSADIYKPYHSFHVGVDKHQYRPMSIQYAIEHAKWEITNKPKYIQE